MSTESTSRRWTATLASVLVVMACVVTQATPSQADTRPPTVGTPTTVSADVLPTVQIDGVAWTQVTVGNIVYVGGKFNTARPAGAPAGSNTTVRHNLLAYDITTGALVTSFAPDLNAQVLALATSPDKTKLYVAGEFTLANGQTRSRVAAYNLPNGSLISTFKPLAEYTVRAIAASNSAVYLGGDFAAVSGIARSRLAAVDPTSGAVLGWAPIADSTVNAMTLTQDGSKVVAGGRFKNMNAAAAYGMAALDPATGASLPWATTSVIRDAGPNAAILNLTADADGVYGTGYVFGSGGNFEGAFRANPATGAIVWLEDCHGDSYSVFPTTDKVYVTGHAHYCGNIGAYPDTNPRVHHHAQSFSKAPACTVTREPSGSYANFAGNPCPQLLDWFPDFFTGTFTGQGQATWSVSGNEDYISFGGEFPGVNNQAQQGLVRFAVSTKAPNKQGPFSNSTLTPAVAQVTQGVRATWQTTYDRDNEALTYKVYRNFQSTSDIPIYQTTVNSTFWRRPTIGFTDTTVSAGQGYNYRVYVSDPFGNTVSSGATSITATATGASSNYSTAVKSDYPKDYWRLGENSGSTVRDWAGINDAVAKTGVTRQTPGAIAQDANTASTFDGTVNGTVGAQVSESPSDTVSLEAWVKTTTTRGGKIVGFGDRNTSDSTSYDRHLYLDNTGRVFFGVFQGSARTINSPGIVNDGQWHHIVATLGPNGMNLFVDAQLVAGRSDTTGGQAYTGYWRIGGDSLSSWPSAPTSKYLAGAIDEVAIYPVVLQPARVSAHYSASGRGGAGNQSPVAAFTSSSSNLQASFNGSGSSDPDGSISSYSWNFGDGSPAGSGVASTHVYGGAGTFSVTLTVTDNAGATNAVTKSVTVSAANQSPVAAFTSSSSNLQASFNGSGSSDPDGSISSYSWNFGDGSPAGSGVAPTHVYGGAGTFSVTLTVTDNAGATNAVTKPVTVSAGGIIAQDAFERAVADGLGSADVGGTWTVSGGATNFDVADGVAKLTLTGPGSSPAGYLTSVTSSNSDLQADIRFDKAATGGGTWAGLEGRGSRTNGYRGKLRIASSGAVSVEVVRVVSSGETSLGTAVVTGITYAPGDPITLRMQVVGSGPTTLKLKAWRTGTVEPASWLVSTTDATAALQTLAGIGIWTYISGSATNAPVVASFDNLVVKPSN